ncbi:uncharacterized protein IWZ02DRAFT_370854 [Phyllosticta citriasiana]|uniref:Calponin-homology (CH) domain-containing protein n=1 Tax=Phyllosticta citriasiana TaxID=595635 RepID=A0ABR1KWV6_9PEZI
MNRYAQATPCPAPSPLSTLAHQNNAKARSLGTFHDDETTNIDFTVQSKQDILNVKPRKRATRTKKAPAFDPSTDIWLDDAIPQSPQHGRKSSPQHTKDSASRSRSRGSKKPTTLAQPPQRFPIPPAPTKEDGTIGQRRRRVSALLAEKGLTPSISKSGSNTRDGEQKKKQLEIQKDPRRRTIYVPSDDTTIMTIHPGACKCDGRLMDFTANLGVLPEEKSAAKPPVPKEKTAARRSIAAAPKRAPLQKSSRSLQGTSIAEDIMGSGIGKENVPPGLVKPEKKLSNGLKTTPEVVKNRVSKPVKVEPMRVKKTQSTSQLTVATRIEPSRKRQSSENIQIEKPSKALKAHRNATPARAPLGDKTNKNMAASKSPKPRILNRQQAKPASKLSVPLLAQKIQKVDEKYKIVSNDLSSPALYEDNWLSYQEVAITQLVNKLFDSVDLTTQDLAQENGGLRRMLLSVYQEPAMPVLYKRIQASLMYGALSIPQDLLSKAIRLKDDVGLRRKYLKLFVDTYDPFILAAALEAIVGRQLSSQSRLSTSKTPSDGETRRIRALKKTIQDFLDTFFVRHEDAIRVKTGTGTISSIARGQKKENDDFGSQGWSWRRTVLRSLMLVLLLDKSKTRNIVNLPLFQSGSPYKSSNAVLQQLASMLFPSLGDVSRPLSHLNYELKCVQAPLEEYSYRIDNLATDMRDGVMLTRLVEVLLYTPATLPTQKDITVTMPTGDVLTTTFKVDDKDCWILSQHLKLPCVGRTQKLFNVQVALSALGGIKGAAGRAVKDIKAENIVDGHREKTLGLLWALVGKWGLEMLVDWAELSRETLRHREKFYAHKGDDDCRDPYSESEPESEYETGAAGMTSLAKHTARLKAWAHGIARLQGLRVANLTTSFADDRVLEAIVDQYLPCFPSAVTSNSSAGDASSLKTKLKAIGCSDSFVSLYTPSTTASAARPIPSKDFTTTTLAFLASRLLPASRAHRAACKIQRWYRLRLARREATRRVVLMRLAAHCATVVQTRDKVVGAAVVLQRAWRRVLDTRIGRLIGDVLGFQAAARGWAVRRKLAPSKGGKVKRRENVRGGW